MSEYIPKLFDLLQFLVLAVLVPLVKHYLGKQETAEAIRQLNDFSKQVVDRLNKERRELQDPSRPGAWSSEEGKRLLQAAIAEVISLLGDSVELLEKRYGSHKQVLRIIENAIEAHVESTRGTAVGARAPSIPAPAPAPAPAPSPAPAAEAEAEPAPEPEASSVSSASGEDRDSRE